MSERYRFSLSQDLLERAVNELNEPRDDELRWKAIDELRSTYNSDKYGPLCRSDDAFMMQFLRAKKFDQAKSLQMLQNYHNVRKQYKDVFTKMSNPNILKPVIETGAFLVLDGETKQGAKCAYYRSGLLDPSADPYEMTAGWIMVLEKLLEDEQFQICGLETIQNLAGFSMLLMAKVTPSLSKMKAALQEALPVRMRGIYIINEGTIFDLIMVIVKPFMRKKILDRIHVYGGKYSLLQDHVDKSILPPCLGGTGPDADALAAKWVEILSGDYSEDTAL